MNELGRDEFRYVHWPALAKELPLHGHGRDTLHPDKTRLVDFRPQMTEGARHPETDGASDALLDGVGSEELASN